MIPNHPPPNTLQNKHFHSSYCQGLVDKINPAQGPSISVHENPRYSASLKGKSQSNSVPERGRELSSVHNNNKPRIFTMKRACIKGSLWKGEGVCVCGRILDRSTCTMKDEREQYTHKEGG